MVYSQRTEVVCFFAFVCVCALKSLRTCTYRESLTRGCNASMRAGEESQGRRTCSFAGQERVDLARGEERKTYQRKKRAEGVRGEHKLQNTFPSKVISLDPPPEKRQNV